MADQSSDETIRQMLSGFSRMQAQMGLLPMQGAQAMAGAGTQFQTPPPPPQIMHPADAALQSMQRHNDMIQQTLQAAQVNRYIPPPSAPTPSVSAMVGMGAMNPFMAPPVGGGGFMPGSGGGFAPMGGMGMSGPRMPSVFNPFAPTMPTAHFASPGMRNVQMMHHAQSQLLGTVAGMGEGAMGMGGSMVGGALGSLIGGPLGALAGSYVGGKVGGMMASMVFNPSVQDMSRGRQIQSMTSPFMVSGPMLNSMTGQGLDALSARQTATGIRHLQRDHDFERTGFNTQDTMKVMQMSADAGLLSGANSPDQLVQKVKDISKMVKTIVRIGGDPDIQHAIQSLGQMRDLGFNSLSLQGGALANRSAFARMAGVSQGVMNQFGMAGADMAGQFGLGGATGYNAGMSGAANANMANSSGALNALQMSRAGGQAGLGATNAQGQLAAMNNELYLLAGSKVGKNGKLEMDMEGYRRAQGMSFDDVARLSADKMKEMQAHGIFDWSTRKQEIKDQIAQSLKPGEAQINMYKQAQAFQARVPGMTLGVALEKTMGLTEQQGRDLENQGASRAYWDTQIQQTNVQRRTSIDQDRARRAQLRTPGFGTRMGRGVRDTLGNLSDTVSSPFTAFGDRLDRVTEENDAAEYGQHIVRVSDAAIMHDDAERAMARAGMGSRAYRSAYRTGVGGSSLNGGDAMGGGFLRTGAAGMMLGMPGMGSMFGQAGLMGGNNVNRIGSMLGVSSLNAGNRANELANKYNQTWEGLHPFSSFGDSDESMKRINDIAGAGAAVEASRTMTAKDYNKTVAGIGPGGGAHMARATVGLIQAVNDLKAGRTTSSSLFGGVVGSMASSAIGLGPLGGALFGGATSKTSAGALTKEQARKIFIDTAEGDKAAAARQFDSDPSIMAGMVKQASIGMDTGGKEVLGNAVDVHQRAGGFDPTRSRQGAKRFVGGELSIGGLNDENYHVDEKTLSKLGSLFAHHSDDEMELAAVMKAMHSDDPKEKAAANKRYNELTRKLGDKFGDVSEGAGNILNSADEATSTAIGRMQTSGRFGTTSGAVASVRGALQHIKGNAAHGALSQVLAKYGGKDSDDILESVRGVDMDKLEAGEGKKVADAVRAMTAGDEDSRRAAADDAAMIVAPTNTATRYGGQMKSIDEQVGAMRDLSDTLAKSDDGSDAQKKAEAQVGVASTQLFATAVQQFCDTVAGKNLDGLMPDRQSTQ